MICREPILVQSELARFKKIVYRGYAEMVYSDLLEALDSERAIIRYAGDKHSRGATWAKDFIEVGPIRR